MGGELGSGEVQVPDTCICPICAGIMDPGGEHTHIKPDDIVDRGDSTLTFVSPYFVRGSEGHVIVVSKEHYKTFKEVPRVVGGNKVFDATRKAAAAMILAYSGVEWITTISSDKPEDGYHSAHYQVAVYPRKSNDELYASLANPDAGIYLADLSVRAELAAKLRPLLVEPPKPVTLRFPKPR